MSDKRRFLQHALIFGVGGILGQLVPLILFPLYTNYLTTTEYGILDVITRTSDIINTVFLIGGIRLAAMTFYKQAENEEARKKIAVTISLLLWFTVAIAISAAIYFVDYLEMFLKTGNTKLLAFGLAIALLEALVGVPMTLTQARLESLRFVLNNITMLFTRLFLCVYFVTVLRWGVFGVLLAQGIVFSIFAVLLTFRELWIGSIYPDISKWKEIFKFALPLVPGGLLAFFYTMSDRFFIINFGPYETEAAALGAVGIYAVADRLMTFTRYFGISPMQLVWNAEMYDIYANRPDAASVFGNFAYRLFCVQIFWGFIISLFANEMVSVVCDPSYYGAAALVPLFGIGFCISILMTQMINTFFIVRKTYLNFYSNVMALPCIIIFMALLVPKWGIVGAVIAALLSRCAYFFFLYIISQRYFAIRYPFKKIIILSAITLFCYGLSLFCGNGFDVSEQFRSISKWERLMSVWDRIRFVPIFAKMGIIILWSGIVWFSGILSPEEKDMVLRTVKKILRKFGLRIFS